MTSPLLPAYPDYEKFHNFGASVPKEWRVLPLKYTCSYNDEVLPETTEADVELQYVDIGSVSAATGISYVERMPFSEAPSRARRVARVGDVIVSTVRTYLEAVAPIESEGLTVSTGFAVIRPRKVAPQFLAYLLRSRQFIDEVVSRSVGVSYPAINSTDLVRIPLPLPCLDEQKTIASFLDHETAKIDELIAKQRRLIELLKEKRQAVISRAVTKGLNPDVPMKDSGVEWLGEVPEHWSIKKGGYLGQLFGSLSVSDTDVQREGSIPYLKVESMLATGLMPKEPSWYVTEKAVKGVKIERNFIVFPKRGAAIFTNKVNVINFPALIDPNLMGWRITGPATTSFVAYCLLARTLTDLADVSTVPQINNKHISPVKFACPPIEEQEEIVKSIEYRTTRVDQLTKQCEEMIRLSRERRTALISAAVTGKIDVRNWKPNDTQ